MPRRNPSSSVTSQMLSGIADSLWVVAWHTYAGSRAPATPPGAYEAAQDFLDLMSDAASQTVDQMWRAVEHLLPNPRAFGEAAWEMSQGGSVRGMSNYAIPLFDVEFDGNDLTWEGQTRHAVQPKKRKGRKTARRDVARAIKAAGLSPRSAGLNADWSNSAWHLGPGGSPNQVDGDYYIVEDEDDADHFYLFQYFPVALNEGDMDEGEARVELHDGTLDSVIDAARQEMTLRNNPRSKKRSAIHNPKAKKSFFGTKPAGKVATRKPLPTLTDDEFEAVVQEAANAAPEHHGFGSRKVFIHRVYEGASALSPAIARLSLEEFKHRLNSVFRMRQSRLRLTRADLVQAMDPRDVAASNIDAGGASYNFIERS